MRFRSGAKLDPSQVTDARGRGGMGGPVLAGGGGLGVVGLVIFVLYTVLSGGSGAGGLGSLDGQSVSTGAPSTLNQDCKTGADANERQDCRIVADVNSIQRWWATRLGDAYEPATTVFFSGVRREASFQCRLVTARLACSWVLSSSCNMGLSPLAPWEQTEMS